MANVEKYDELIIGSRRPVCHSQAYTKEDTR